MTIIDSFLIPYLKLSGISSEVPELLVRKYRLLLLFVGFVGRIFIVII